MWKSAQRLSQESLATRAEVAAMKADLTRTREVLEDLAATLATRRARANSLNTGGDADDARAVAEEKRVLTRRVDELAAECGQIDKQVQEAREALVALVPDDMSVDSWLAPSTAPESSPPHSPTMSLQASACPSPSTARYNASGAQLFVSLFPYVGQSEDELSFGPGEIIGWFRIPFLYPFFGH